MDSRIYSCFRGPLKAVILDWAGTVVDYGSYAPVAALLRLFEARGLPLTVAQARLPMGADKKDHIRQILQMEAVSRAWQARYGQEPVERDVDALFTDFVPLQRQVLAEYAAPIPGALEAVTAFRRCGLKVGSTTGYNREMMALLAPEAARRGYQPDSIVCADEVPAGRPAPWMALLSAQQMGIYPMSAIVKVGDTLLDIAEGLNAGMWAVGLALTGNELGLLPEEISRLDPQELQARREVISQRMRSAGAHYVVDGLWDVPAVLDEINARLAEGQGT